VLPSRLILFDVLLNSVCHYFAEDFASMFIKEIGLLFSSLEVSLPGFGISVILASQNVFGSFPSLSISWNSLRRVGINSSLKV
jgi:hypothetical protein